MGVHQHGFCAGVLLRMLTTSAVDGSVGGVTHILVDEIHERSMLTDFLLTLLRDRSRSAGNMAVPHWP